MAKKKYIDGIFVKDPHEKAPDFVLGRIAINREKAIKSLQEMDDEWINIDVLKSRDGNVYGKLDTYKKEEENTGNDDYEPENIDF